MHSCYVGIVLEGTYHRDNPELIGEQFQGRCNRNTYHLHRHYMYTSLHVVLLQVMEHAYIINIKKMYTSSTFVPCYTAVNNVCYFVCRIIRQTDDTTVPDETERSGNHVPLLHVSMKLSKSQNIAGC